jgi:magnesium transporter
MEVLDRVDPQAIRALHERDEFFWLDLLDPSAADLDELGRLLGIPPLALQDSREFGQRPKIDGYDRQALVVFYGAQADRLLEVHLHISGNEVVTVRRTPCAHVEDLRRRATSGEVGPEAELVYRVLDALADSLGALVDACATEVDQLEEVAFERPTDAQRRRISELRGELFRLQQTILPQRDMLAAGGELIESLPGLDLEDMRHPLRDVHDHLVLIANQVEYGREVLGEALNVFLSTTSNRLNETAARLTMIATIVLPLTLVTGFFGQNFGWMVRHIDTLQSFLIFGIGGMVVPTAIGLALFARAGYFRRG